MSQASAADPAGIEVTFVGGGEASQAYWRGLLEPEGLALRFVAAEPDVLATVEDARPQVLVADCAGVPDWLEALRVRPRLSNLPLIVLLAEARHASASRHRAIAEGADDVLATPRDDALLAGTIRARLDRARAGQPSVGAGTPRRAGALRRGEFLAQLGAVLAAGADDWQVLMALRIDQAKALSESLGQAAAYELEQAVAARFANALAEGDAHSLWMPFGFGLLVRRGDRAQVEALAKELCRCISQAPFVVSGAAQRLTASVGIALAPGTGGTAEADRWFASAHAAQAIAHRLGGDRFDGVLSRDHGNLPPERVLIIREWVKEAVAGDNVIIEFQPVLPLRGADGLYRLDARLRDYRAPLAGVGRSEYLGLARDAGALPMIDRMSLFSAFEAIEQERAQGRATQLLVPLDLATLGDAQLVWLDAELRRRKAHSDGLIVEFDAQMALGRPELVRVVQRLEDHGIVIALSDESGDLGRIAQLQRFPASLLRLPLAAVDSVPPARFRTLLEPWRNSGRALVADRVADVGAVARLFDLDISFVQGDALAAGGPRLDYEFTQFGA